MKTLLIAAVAVALAGPALACSGTAEYPQTAQTLAQSSLTPERKAELDKALKEGWTMHSESHEQGDYAKMGQSMQILRELQAQIPEK
jgi:hypothetical protein